MKSCPARNLFLSLLIFSSFPNHSQQPNSPQRKPRQVGWEPVLTMAPMSQEDLEWFKSTFRPIPKPEIPDDAVDYALYHIPSSPAPATLDEVAETRARLVEVQKTAAELIKDLLKDYIWQREIFRLEITKDNGMRCPSIQA